MTPNRLDKEKLLKWLDGYIRTALIGFVVAVVGVVFGLYVLMAVGAVVMGLAAGDGRLIKRIKRGDFDLQGGKKG